MQTKKHVTCSALLVNYNDSALIERALSAALNQTVPFDEIIVIDDASTDTSVEIINRLIAGFPQARLIRNPQNIGVMATCNIALQQVTGDFVFFLSSDDEYSTRIIEWCRPIFTAYPDIGMIAGNVTIHNIDHDRMRHFTLPFPKHVGRYAAEDISSITKKRNFTFFGGGNVMRRDAILAAGSLRTDLKWNADWFLYLMLGYRHPFVVVQETFARIRQTDSQYSHASYYWQTQRPVIESFIRLLHQDYPQEYPFFRANALLPTYDLPALFLLLRDPQLRPYLTRLLVWRLLTYKLLRMVGRLLPDSARSMIRQLLRV